MHMLWCLQVVAGEASGMQAAWNIAKLHAAAVCSMSLFGRPPMTKMLGSWVSCNFHFCLGVTCFLLGYNFLLALSLSKSAAVPACLAHWRTRTGLAITTTFDNDSTARGQTLEFFVPCHPLKKDPFPVPPFNGIKILRKFRVAFGLLLGKLAGPPSFTLPSSAA